MDDDQRSLPDLIAGLLPSTRRWLLARGYIEYVTEDGYTFPKITPQGYAFFNQSHTDTGS